jgi:hypothetical protein
LLVHDYQDDFYWEAFEDRREGESYADRLKSVARRVTDEDLTWSLCSHDHACATREGFDKKGRWFREIVEYALRLGSRFLTATEFYNEMLARQDST